MKLKHGKRYETADGTVYLVDRCCTDVYQCVESGHRWQSDGKGCREPNGLKIAPDLIRRHYTKPKPADKLDLQPGDVVELCGWEDKNSSGVGSVWKVDGDGEVDSSLYGFYDQSPGQGPLFKIISRASWSK